MRLLAATGLVAFLSAIPRTLLACPACAANRQASSGWETALVVAMIVAPFLVAGLAGFAISRWRPR